MEPCIYHTCGQPATKCIVDEKYWVTGQRHIATIWLCDEHYNEEVFESYREVWDKVEV